MSMSQREGKKRGSIELLPTQLLEDHVQLVPWFAKNAKSYKMILVEGVLNKVWGTSARMSSCL